MPGHRTGTICSDSPFLERESVRGDLPGLEMVDGLESDVLESPPRSVLVARAKLAGAPVQLYEA